MARKKQKSPDIVLRTHRDRNYKTISCVGLEDAQLSLSAKGLLMYLITRPDGWKFNRDKLCETLQISLRAFWGVARQLRARGYYRTKPIREGKRFTGQQWEISEAPQPEWVKATIPNAHGGIRSESDSEREPLKVRASQNVGDVFSNSCDNQQETTVSACQQVVEQTATTTVGHKHSEQEETLNPSAPAVPVDPDDSKSARTTGHDTWLTPYAEVFKRYYGADPSPRAFGILGKNLKPLVEKYDTASVLDEFEAYCAQTTIKWFSVPRFASLYGTWTRNPSRGLGLLPPKTLPQGRRF